MYGEGKSVNSLVLLCSGEIKKFVGQYASYLFSANLQISLILQGTKNHTVCILGINVAWKLRSWKIAAV